MLIFVVHVVSLHQLINIAICRARLQVHSTLSSVDPALVVVVVLDVEEALPLHRQLPCSVFVTCFLALMSHITLFCCAELQDLAATAFLCCYKHSSRELPL